MQQSNGSYGHVSSQHGYPAWVLLLLGSPEADFARCWRPRSIRSPRRVRAMISGTRETPSGHSGSRLLRMASHQSLTALPMCPSGYLRARWRAPWRGRKGEPVFIWFGCELRSSAMLHPRCADPENRYARVRLAHAAASQRWMVFLEGKCACPALRAIN